MQALGLDRREHVRGRAEDAVKEYGLSYVILHLGLEDEPSEGMRRGGAQGGKRCCLDMLAWIFIRGGGGKDLAGACSSLTVLRQPESHADPERFDPMVTAPFPRNPPPR